MVEPLSIAATATSLVFRGIKIVKAISDFRSAYKLAPLALISISTECSIINAALSRIQQLSFTEASSLAARIEAEPDLVNVFDSVLTSFASVLSLLEEDIGKLSEKDKIKIVWNEKSLVKKLELLRGQELAIVVLLNIMQRWVVRDLEMGSD